MTKPLDQNEALAIVDAMTPALGIDVQPDWRAPIAANVISTANAARLILDFPLTDDVEPAPVFRA